MDSVAVSRRNRKVSSCKRVLMSILYMFSSLCCCFFKLPYQHQFTPPILFQTNKENDRPVFERRPVVKRDEQPAAPFQLKTSSKEGTLSKSGTRFATETQKRVKTFIKDGREAAATGKQPARSRTVLGEQAGKDNKIIEEVPAPPATAPSKLGVYKGKVVQSKIGAIWKTSTTACSAETKPSTIKAKIPNVKNDAQSTSVAAAAARSRAVQKPAQVARSAVTGRPPAQCFPARPPTRPVHSKISNTVPRNSKKATSNENSKPSTLRAEKVNKPASSSLSEYRLTMETAEERRYGLLEFGYSALFPPVILNVIDVLNMLPFFLQS